MVAKDGSVVALHFASRKATGNPLNYAKPAYLIREQILAHLGKPAGNLGTSPTTAVAPSTVLTVTKPFGVVILNQEPREGTLQSGTIVYVRNMCDNGNIMKITGGSNRNSAGQRISGRPRAYECLPGISTW